MAFQPFGYRFEVSSTMPPERAKAALRSGMKRWFEPKNGPRGWIAGPFLCLWLSAFDQHGPMVFARISNDNFGTRVSGRAGSDLNGMLALVFCGALLIFALFLMARDDSSIGQMVYVGPIALVIFPLALWFAHKDRRRAEPLIRFVRTRLDVGRPQSAPRIFIPSSSGSYLPMTLNVGGDDSEGTTTPEAIARVLEAIVQGDGESFLILDWKDGHFMQAALDDAGFVLEKCEGGEETHVVACRVGDAHESRGFFDSRGGRFTEQEVLQAMTAYLEGQSQTPGVRWERLYS